MDKQANIRDGLIQITKSKPMAYELLRFLRDNSVVIKVDGELPSIFNSNEDVISALEYQKGLIGYVAVESLMGDKDEQEF